MAAPLPALMMIGPTSLLTLLCFNAAAVSSQLAWTPIYVGSNSTNDHKNLTEWIRRLDQMTHEEGKLERLLYVKYLVMTLSGMYGLVEPFTSSPTEIIRPLRTILPPLVYADLVEERPEKCFRTAAASKVSLGSDGQANETKQPVQEDRLFYTQQLFPPEGILCYAAAFSAL